MATFESLWFEGFDDLDVTSTYGPQGTSTTTLANPTLLNRKYVYASSSANTITGNATRFNYGAAIEGSSVVSGATWTMNYITLAQSMTAMNIQLSESDFSPWQMLTIGFATKGLTATNSISITSGSVTDPGTVVHPSYPDQHFTFNTTGVIISGTGVGIDTVPFITIPADMSDWNYYELAIAYRNGCGQSVLNTHTTWQLRQNTILLANGQMSAPPCTAKPFNIVGAVRIAGLVDDVYVGVPNIPAGIEFAYLGDARVTVRQPAADGSLTDFIPNSGTTNFDKVNTIIPDGDATYVQTTATHARDLYTPTANIYIPAQIHGVKVVAYAKDTGAGTTSLEAQGKIGSTYFGERNTLGSAYKAIGTTVVTIENPVTDLPWTNADISNLEFGIYK